MPGVRWPAELLLGGLKVCTIMNDSPRKGTIRRAAMVAMAIAGFGASRAAGEITDKQVYLPPAPPALPSAGQTFVDPTFGTTVMRLTDASDGSDNKNAYAYWPTFNRSSTKLFVDSNGTPKLYDFNPYTMQISNKRDLFARRAPDNGVVVWEDAIWSGTDPNVIYGHTNLNLWAYNVQSTQYTLVKNFGAELPPGHLRQMSKSIDDQVFGFTKQNQDYAQTGNFAWRRDTDQVVLDLNDPANTNEIQVDKSGRYVMVSHEAQGANVIQTTIVDLQTNTSEPLTDGAPDFAPGHGDLGHGFSVAADNWNNRLTGRSLADPHNPYTVLSFGSDWSQSEHLSMLADDEQWGLLSKFYADTGHPSSGLYRDEILLVATDGSQNVRRLAHHHSNFAGQYWNSPRANISFDGKFVAFTSNWGDLSRRDVFLLRIGGAPLPAWNVNAAGNWHSDSNWTSPTAPNGVGAEAELGAIITATRTLYADQPLTLGTLRFNDNNTYHLSGGAALTMQVSSGSALLDVHAGAHKLNLPLIIASDTTLNIESGAALTISDPVTINSGKILTHIGTGTVSYQSLMTLQSGAGVSFAGAMDVEAVILDAGAGAELTVSGQKVMSVRSDPAGGATSLGIIDDAEADEFVIRSTFYGDADLSGIVDAGDFGRFLNGFDDGAAPVWVNGDFDYSQAVDLEDFDLFLNGVRGQGYMSSELLAALGEFVDANQLDVDLTTVPEPAILPLVAIAGLALRRRR